MAQMTLAPILVFGFNRPDLFKSTLLSLKADPLSQESDVFLFIDGPRNDDDVPKVQAVKDVANDIEGFRSKTVICSDVNKGLSKSIISGTTEIVNKYGRVIVLEDDLLLSPGFLTCMNTMLDTYESDSRIMQVSGFSTKFKRPKDLVGDIYLNRRAESWSWGTWLDRWKTIDWNVSDYADFASDRKLVKDFNGIGSDLFRMLKDSLSGRNDSWAVRFAYSMFRQGRYTACPIKSLVRNTGFDSRATHSKGYDRYKIEFNESGEVAVPVKIEYNKEADRRANVYWTLRWRICGKLKSLLYG